MKEREVWGSLLPGNSFYKKGVSQALAQMSYDTFNGELGEIDLFVTMIVMAAKDRDWTFFNSTVYEAYCDLIGLNHLTTLKMICGVTDYFDFGIGEIEPSLLNMKEEEYK